MAQTMQEILSEKHLYWRNENNNILEDSLNNHIIHIIWQ